MLSNYQLELWFDFNVVRDFRQVLSRVFTMSSMLSELTLPNRSNALARLLLQLNGLYPSCRRHALQPVTLLLAAGLLGGLLCPHQAQAQTDDASDATASIGATTIPARFGVNHTTSGAGLDGITGIQGFVPLVQTPGSNVTYVDGRLLLDNGGHLGGNLLLGYRQYNGDRNRITGGYLGFDSRATDDSSFYQLGAGFESLGLWDFRVNGYLPIGQTSNRVQDIDIDTGLQTTSGFAGNQLVLNSIRERQRILMIEDALGGFDLEAGGRIAGWKGGDLRAYGGVYALGGDKTDTFLGGKLRLAANVTPNVTAGLAVHHDGEFGTNLVASVGLSFPGIRDSQKTDAAEEIAPRLRESVARNPNIAVATQREAESFFENNTQALQNPEEAQDYRFVHVSLTAGAGGDGSYEAPLGSVQAAVDLIASDPTTYSDGNTVVYVDGEGAAPIPGFTIPERVRVLSQGPEQFLAGLPFPGFPEATVRLPFSRTANFDNGVLVQLPDSGDGVFPVVTGGPNNLVTAGGDRVVLAGFQLQDAVENAFYADGSILSPTDPLDFGLQNVELRNNRIVNPGTNGIFLDNVGGSVILMDNEIQGAQERGIYAENRTTLQAVDIAIAGYEVSNSNVGMEFVTVGAPQQVPNQVVAITPSSTDNTSRGVADGTAPSNSIVDNLRDGIRVEAQGTGLAATSQEILVDQATIARNGGAGVYLAASNSAGQQELTVTGSQVRENLEAGVLIRNGTLRDGTPITGISASPQEIFIRGNEIARNGGSGVDITVGSFGNQELTIDDNQILNNGGDGIRSVVSGGTQEWSTNESIDAAGIRKNLIAGNAEQAIDVDVSGTANLAVLNVIENELRDNGGGADLDVVALSPTVTACVVADGNTVPSGITLQTLSLAPSLQATFFVRSRDLLSSLNNGVPVQLLNGATNPPSSDPNAFIDVGEVCIR